MTLLKKLWNKYDYYILNIVIALLVGLLAGLITRPGMEAYAEPEKPPLSPPGWLFPIVWTILYILMGTAAGIVQRTDSHLTPKAMRAYYAQLSANFFWPIIFFGLAAKLAAFFWLLMLLALVIYTAKQFGRISITAKRLLLPYILWLLFAAYLNFATFLLNR